MSDGAMLVEAAERLIGNRIDDAAMRRARAGEWLAAEWDALAGMGLPLALVDEDAGGFGVAPEDAFALVRLTGRHALPLPLAETMVANHALGRAGLPLAERAAVLIDGADLTVSAEDKGWRLSGTAARVPWGRDIGTLVVVHAGRVFRLDTGWAIAEAGTNLAAMPRDTLAIDARCDVAGTANGLSALQMGAVIRTLQIAGALERVLELTVGFVSERVQFGKPLSKFQAVQHDLARLGGEVAAAGAAADMAVEAFVGDPARAALPIAAARIRTGEAAGVAAGIAQQLHGAIGFTAEHRLHWYTTSLWSWRDEYGGQRYWTDMLGTATFTAGGAGFWQFVTEAA
ncbi:acyl-CoA dehydrogenase (plasmid) [Sphingomonas paeninsulae]|uniref:Acyl-CoA dehydrogenase n=1 Tax=Sphingomonas paeninsulae TaxID=2319844 RepID=A0A494TH74_SPHPE|nr:acyl-CoA dehydrogenase family protein [Sphingomonas paeninsulae]AYJ85196.1 acyl-CoA dehydrogenase [Sphingomonas paeninsulae]